MKTLFLPPLRILLVTSAELLADFSREPSPSHLDTGRPYWREKKSGRLFRPAPWQPLHEPLATENRFALERVEES